MWAMAPGDTYLSATTTKKMRTRIFTSTMPALKRADSRMPRTRMTVIRATIASASRLKTIGTPKTCGALA